jgi:hypothetical protein
MFVVWVDAVYVPIYKHRYAREELGSKPNFFHSILNVAPMDIKLGILKFITFNGLLY